MKLNINHPSTNLNEKTLSTELVFQGRFLQVHRDQALLPDGQKGIREYIRHPGAVVVVPILDDGRLLVERQFRYPVGHVMLEFPAGKLDAGEPPKNCGTRELLEETGYTATQWAEVGTMHNAIGYSDEAIHVHFARGLQYKQQSLDQGEFLEVISVSHEELQNAIRDGCLTDAKTITALYWYEKYLQGSWKVSWQDVIQSGECE